MKNYTKHIISLLLFGSNGIIANNVNVSSYEIVFWRTMMGSLLLVSIFFLTSHKPTFMQHKKDTFYIVISGISMGASWMFLYEAFSQIGVSIATLIYYCGPVIVMVLSPILFNEKLGVENVISFVAVFIGIFLINGESSGQSINKWGIFCGLMSALTYSLMVIFNKKSQKVTGLENSVIQLVVSFITLSIFMIFKTGFHFYAGGFDWLHLIIIGIINTGIGCYLYFSTIANLPVQSVAILGYLEPLCAILLSFFLLGESMTFVQSLGAVLIIGGAAFGNFVKFLRQVK